MRDWLRVHGDHRGPGFIYLVHVLTYGTKHPIKVGVAKDVANRMAQLGKMGIHAPSLLGTFSFDDMKEAKRIETLVRRAFPRCPQYGDRSREILDATEEDLVAFITEKTGKQFNKAAGR